MTTFREQEINRLAKEIWNENPHMKWSEAVIEATKIVDSWDEDYLVSGIDYNKSYEELDRDNYDMD